MSSHLEQILLTAVVTAVVSLLVMESYQTTPWLAGKVMRWSVQLRYADNPERATVRDEEMISLLEDLPTLLKLPTAGGFLFRAITYRLTHRRAHTRRERQATQHTLGARFRIALAKSGLVFVCTSTVFGIEIFAFSAFFMNPSDAFILCGVFGIWGGVVAASEFVSRPSRLPAGLIGGITNTLLIFGLWSGWAKTGSLAISVFLGGMAFALTTALAGKFKYRKVTFGFFVNFAGILLLIFSLLIFPRLDTLSGVTDTMVGLGLMVGPGLIVGSLAEFAITIEHGLWRKKSSDYDPRSPQINVDALGNTPASENHISNGLSPQAAPGHAPEDPT